MLYLIVHTDRPNSNDIIVTCNAESLEGLETSFLLTRPIMIDSSHKIVSTTWDRGAEIGPWETNYLKVNLERRKSDRAKTDTRTTTPREATRQYEIAYCRAPSNEGRKSDLRSLF